MIELSRSTLTAVQVAKRLSIDHPLPGAKAWYLVIQNREDAPRRVIAAGTETDVRELADLLVEKSPALSLTGATTGAAR